MDTIQACASKTGQPTHIDWPILLSASFSLLQRQKMTFLRLDSEGLFHYCHTAVSPVFRHSETFCGGIYPVFRADAAAFFVFWQIFAKKAGRFFAECCAGVLGSMPNFPLCPSPPDPWDKCAHFAHLFLYHAPQMLPIAVIGGAFFVFPLLPLLLSPSTPPPYLNPQHPQETITGWKKKQASSRSR